ncbi:Stk1 family PASTA domain-containing Ser/Thr kinase [Leucobacter exalbidus]|nr:Stk1 family PASTA domain-containing Ser/Thr kinase [Leucobacter exalbidus]
MIGHTFDGRYAIRSRIARGGMAMVYLANDVRLERRVAVKVMHEHLAEDENFRRRFDQEARSAAGLSHPNLVNVFDQGFDAGRNYLVMEYLPSITLRDLLKRQRTLTIEQTLEIGEAILAGLSAAHHAGIVHRDLKPENVMLADDGRIKLGDFGLARAVSANTTTGQALLGTIAYLSPELVTRGIADERSDLYAFGIMLYEMLTGAQPFVGEQPMQIAYQHAHSDVPAPSLASEESTPELDALVRWLTQRDPEYRPRDAGAALDHLRGIISGTADPVPQPAATTVMPGLAPTTAFTPSTTVLSDAQLDELGGADDDADTDEPPVPETPIDRAAFVAHRRGRRGRIVAAVAIVAILAAGGTGWWFGQGPGSAATVPEVTALSVDDALATISNVGLSADVVGCPSVEVPAGDAVGTEPEAGSKVDRGATIRLCQSTGPRILTVPTLVGLTLDEAKTAIDDAKFSFGSASDERFFDSPKGTVLAALDADKEPLEGTYPEQGEVNLVVSAGPVPSVAGSAEKAAIAALTKVDLVIDEESRAELYDADVAKGDVISVALSADPLRPGDLVSLTVSAGKIPAVAGESKKKAISAIKKAGLTLDESQVTETWNADVPVGDVIDMTFQEAPVRPGDPVGLSVSLGPELFPVPDISGMPLQDAMNAVEAAGFVPTTLVPDALRSLAKATGTDPAAASELPAGTEIRVKSTISL